MAIKIQQPTAYDIKKHGSAEAYHRAMSAHYRRAAQRGSLDAVREAAEYNPDDPVAHLAEHFSGVAYAEARQRAHCAIAALAHEAEIG